MTSPIYKQIRTQMEQAIIKDDVVSLNELLLTQEAGDIHFQSFYSLLFKDAAMNGSIDCLEKIYEIAGGQLYKDVLQLAIPIAAAQGHGACLQFLINIQSSDHEMKMLALIRAIERDHPSCIDIMMPYFSMDEIIRELDQREKSVDPNHPISPGEKAQRDRFLLRLSQAATLSSQTSRPRL